MKHFHLTLLAITTTFMGFGQPNTTQEIKKTRQTQKVMAKDTTDSTTKFSKTDLKFFQYCLDLAEEALEAGDQPFGSILVNADNNIIAEARNRVNEKTVLAHPEIELAEWALQNLSFEERREAKMYTTGEHCPMCAAAHGWAQIGSLYFLSSAEQLGKWTKEFGAGPSPIEFIPAEELMKNVTVKGPAKGELVEKIKNMHRRYYQK